MQTPYLKVGQRISTTKFIGLVGAYYLIVSNLLRLTLFGWITQMTHEVPSAVGLAFAKGLIFDFACGFYLFGPVIIYLFFYPRHRSASFLFRILITLLTVIPLLFFSCAELSELFFFDEFHARYNFIAVDYLIYTTEVVRNVLESYSWFTLAAVFLIPIVGLTLVVRHMVWRIDGQGPGTFRSFTFSAALSLTLILSAAVVGEDALIAKDPYWARELSKNSIFALFAAYRRNSINYTEFYSLLPTEEATRLTRTWLKADRSDGAAFREIHNAKPERRWNVVLVVMESMSAGFMGHFGNRQPITPNLDQLADASLFFTNLYATGTRTVRGLEALMLSLPPTPGQSILRRPNSDGLFNLGTVFKDRGYESQFIYGGHAYFDNMKEWFESNAFQVVDRGDFPSEEIHFANAWGVCDEDLFAQVIRQQEALNKDGKPFFQVILTTSNHRPYTFPKGRIDIAPQTGREGAIKYSDYAIGKFIADSKAKPWFNNTLYIFVADHDASVAGGTDIPVHDFQIPAIFYNPNLVEKQSINRLASQLDLGPTLLGLMNFSYRSKFFGQDLLRQSNPRALLGTYQKVGLLQPHLLTILSPGQMVESQELDDDYNLKKTSSVVAKDASSLPESARLTVGIYQTASELFAAGRLKKFPEARGEESRAAH